MTISIKDLISSTMRNSPNFSGSPKVGGENIPTMGSDGELKINGQSIIAKTREYKLPTCWQNIAAYTKNNFVKDSLALGYGSIIYPYSGGSTIFIDPTASTNGTGTFASPYNIWPASIPNDSLVLIKEYSTLSISNITVTATNLMVGSYDADSGERVIDTQKLATISYGSTTKFFTLPTTGTFTLSGVRFISSGAGTNNVIANTSTTLELKIEYCLFANISSLVSGAISGALIDTVGKLSVRFNKVINCTTSGFITTGVAKIYCNEIFYSFITPTTAYGIKVTSNSYADIHHNYIINLVNYGTLVYVSNSGSVTTIRNNYIFGGKSDDIGTSYGINAIGAASTNIHENYVCNGSVGILTTNTTAKIYKNVVCSEYENYTGISGANVVGNTVVRLKGITGTGVIASSIVSNNIIDANPESSFVIGIKTNAGLAQATYNNIYGATNPVVDSVSSILNISATTNMASSSYLDYYFCPLSSSPARNSGSINSTYGTYGTKGAIHTHSSVGLSMDVFSPTNGLSTLQSSIDSKADLASPSFVGSVMINGNTPQVTLFKDFGTESFKTSTGVATNTLGTYSLPNIAGSGLLRITMVYVTGGTGSKTISVKLNGNIVTETTTTIAKISRIEIVCANNVLQTGQIYTVNTDGNTTMTASSVITSGTSTFTVVGTGTATSDTISLKSMIIEQI